MSQQSSHMQIQPNEIHVWKTNLNLSSEQENEKCLLLSADEIERSNRFKFPIHKKRFIAARSMLRILLAAYLNVSPQEIIFAYSKNHKPYLSSQNNLNIKFNLSHSNDIALYAFTLNHDIGIDIEKIRDDYNQAIPKRFFSEQENFELNALSLEQRNIAFYKIWSHKEALAKATGKGLSLTLSSFSISLHQDSQSIKLNNESWSLVTLPIDENYQAAVATNQSVKFISYLNT